ncbi:MAG TPA: ABC transporter ATP-binding protein [Candidatus Dormibacteraeota bacterium]
MDLQVTAGERTAIMGANGAGKTTLLRILATATRPRKGTVEWCGTAVPRLARRWIGFAGDATPDDPGLTGRQSTYFWCRQWSAGSDIHRAVEETLGRLGLADVADEPISGYSFGMRRRLALAQALAHKPRIALLDEPTAGLDADGTASLSAELAMRAEAGDATLVASNDCAFVASACARVIFLNHGHVVADATPEALLASVGDARRVEMTIAENTAPRIGELQTIPGIANVSSTADVVTLDLVDDSALAAVVRTVDAWPGGLHALHIQRPDLSEVFRQLTGLALDHEGVQR